MFAGPSRDADDEDAEYLPQIERFALKYALALAQLDGMQWSGARKTLQQIMFYLTVSPDAPEYYPKYQNRTLAPERTDFSGVYCGTMELSIL